MPYKFLFSLLIFYTSPVIAKYQVCSITINSSDEIETFKEFLSSDNFDFVELLPNNGFNEEQDHDTHWFNEACDKDYQCDILVISGHFGGTFFGESGYALPTELLEEKACKKNCSGILSNVKEIFLFGCYTLADKIQDNRSAEQHRQDLIDYGMAGETAEQVVATIRSPLGTPFNERMNFIFSDLSIPDSSIVYGFDELSPLGRHIRPSLERYFNSIKKEFGSYKNYLEDEDYKRPLNKELFEQLSHTSLKQARISLSNESSEQRTFFNNKCLLYDDTADFTQRIQALKNIFESGQSDSAFFALDYFLAGNTREVTEGEGREIFRSIRKNESLKTKFLSYYEQLDFLPYIKLVYLSILEKFQWIDSFDLQNRKKQNLLELIKTPSPAAFFSTMLLLDNNQIEPGEFYISKGDLPDNYIQNIFSLMILEFLQAEVPDLQSDILKYCKDNITQDPSICYLALNTLAHIHPSLETARQVLAFLEHRDKGFVLYTIRVLGQSGIRDYDVHERISRFLRSTDASIREEALEVLGYLQSPYTDIQDDVAALLSNADEELASKIFWSLRQMDTGGESAQRSIINYILKNRENRNTLTEAFKTLANFSEFSVFSLDFLYQQLDSREDLDLVFGLVENLSRNTRLRDIGIHSRFVQFYKESSQIKQEALKRMAFLTWLHPEIQIAFLNYIKDEDPSVQTLAINILRNVENLQRNTLNEIRSLYENENIKELEVFF